MVWLDRPLSSPPCLPAHWSATFAACDPVKWSMEPEAMLAEGPIAIGLLVLATCKGCCRDVTFWGRHPGFHVRKVVT